MFDEAPLVRSFRRNAAQIRAALAVLDGAPPAAVVPVAPGGVPARDATRLKHYQAFAIPLRRALNPADRASFARTRQAFALAPGRPAQRLGTLDGEWAALQQELDSTVSLGGAPVTRRVILHDWLDAVSFLDPLARENTYDQLLDRLGPAAEGIATPLALRASALVLRLDEAAAEVLDEPLLAPGPGPGPAAGHVPAPPPWWRRLFGGSGGRANRR